MWRHLLLILFLFPLTFAHAQDDERKGLAKEVYNFPKDHYFHDAADGMNEHYVEWFYYTGILTDDTPQANIWGYQVTIFRAGTPNFKTFLYDVALSDVANQRFLHYRGFWRDIGQVQEAESGWWKFQNEMLTLGYEDTTDTWSIVFSGELEDKTDATKHPVTMQFTLVNDKSDYYAHDPSGLSTIGVCEKDKATLDGYTYYYSHPALTTTGIISMGETTLTLQGDTWYDHQWGNFAHCALAWNWFSLRLDDGGNIMIFALLDELGNPLNLLGMTYIDPETGSTENWYGAEDVQLTALREWTHPITDRAFPLDWEVVTPIGTFYVTPFFDYQAPDHFEGIPDYWEGIISVREGSLEGEQIGMGYLEVAR